METLDHYFDGIAEIPVLPRGDQIGLGRELQRARRRFVLATALLPHSPPALLRRWREIRREKRSVEPLVEGFRGPDGPRRAWVFSKQMERLEALVESGATPRQKARAIVHAYVTYSVIEEIWRRDPEECSAADGDPKTDRIRTHARSAHARFLHLRSRLTYHNLRLVIPTAKRFRGRGVDFLDLIQEGNKALIRAAEKFEPERGHGFASYATWWIEQAMIRALQTQGRTVRLPSHVQHLRRSFLERERELRSKLPNDPTPSEVAESLGLEGEPGRQLEAALRRTVSVDSTQKASDFEPLAERLADPRADSPSAALRRRELRNALFDHIAVLPPREQRILEWRFGFVGDEEQTLEAIGQRLGLSRERVRQIEKAALKRLREEHSLRALAEEVGLGCDAHEKEDHNNGCTDTNGSLDAGRD